MRCDSDFVDLILLLLLLRHELLDSVTGVLQIKNLRLLVFFSPRCYFFSSWTVEAAPASSSCFFQKRRRKCFAEGKSLCSKKKKKKIKERFRPLRSSQCGGFNQKSALWPVLPETNSQRSLPRPKPSEEGGLCCELNRGHLSFFFSFFFLRASIMEKIVSCRSGEWLAWRYIDTLMQWTPRTVQ